MKDAQHRYTAFFNQGKVNQFSSVWFCFIVHEHTHKKKAGDAPSPAHCKHRPAHCIRALADALADHRGRINTLLSTNCVAGSFSLSILYSCVVFFCAMEANAAGLLWKKVSVQRTMMDVLKRTREIKLSGGEGETFPCLITHLSKSLSNKASGNYIGRFAGLV